MSAPLVLVVDDERPIVDLVQGYLEREGMEVISAADGPSGLKLIRERAPDVVVLDVMLPGLDGIEVLHRARAFSDAYVLMLTAKAEEVDRIVGLSVGADDYLAKPFSPRELAARVRAMLRRPRAGLGPDDRAWRAGELSVDPRRRSVVVGGAPVSLTTLEFDLLAARPVRGRDRGARRILQPDGRGARIHRAAPAPARGRRGARAAHAPDHLGRLPRGAAGRGRPAR